MTTNHETLSEYTGLLHAAINCLRATKQNNWHALNYAKAGDNARLIELLESTSTSELDNILEKALELAKQNESAVE